MLTKALCTPVYGLNLEIVQKFKRTPCISFHNSRFFYDLFPNKGVFPCQKN